MGCTGSRKGETNEEYMPVSKCPQDAESVFSRERNGMEPKNGAIEDKKPDLQHLGQPISKDHIRKLTEFHKLLVDNIDDTEVKSICDYFIQDGINKVILEKFLDPVKMSTDHVRDLLAYLIDYGTERRYFLFLAVLKECNYWLYKKLTSCTDDMQGVDKYCPTEPQGDASVRVRIESSSSDISEEVLTSHVLLCIRHVLQSPTVSNPDLSKDRPLLLDIVVSAKEGSIILVLSFDTVEQLDAFWELNKSDNLGTALADTFVTGDFKKLIGLTSVTFQGKMSEEEYVSCRQKLLKRKIDDAPSVASTVSLESTQEEDSEQVNTATVDPRSSQSFEHGKHTHEDSQKHLPLDIEALKRSQSTIPYFFYTNGGHGKAHSNSITTS